MRCMPQVLSLHGDLRHGHTIVNGLLIQGSLIGTLFPALRVSPPPHSQTQRKCNT